jgi:hypothetical protein
MVAVGLLGFSETAVGGDFSARRTRDSGGSTPSGRTTGGGAGILTLGGLAGLTGALAGAALPGSILTAGFAPGRAVVAIFPATFAGAGTCLAGAGFAAAGDACFAGAGTARFAATGRAAAFPFAAGRAAGRERAAPLADFDAGRFAAPPDFAGFERAGRFVRGVAMNEPPILRAGRAAALNPCGGSPR